MVIFFFLSILRTNVMYTLQEIRTSKVSQDGSIIYVYTPKFPTVPTNMKWVYAS